MAKAHRKRTRSVKWEDLTHALLQGQTVFTLQGTKVRVFIQEQPNHRMKAHVETPTFNTVCSTPDLVQPEPLIAFVDKRLVPFLLDLF